MRVNNGKIGFDYNDGYYLDNAGTTTCGFSNKDTIRIVLDDNGVMNIGTFRANSCFSSAYEVILDCSNLSGNTGFQIQAYA